MKRIALVNGATGGIGREFVRQISDKGFDEIWAVGRNTQKLSAFNGNVVPVKADIGSYEGIRIICDKINDEKPYMKKDAVIFNVSSASSFQPNPYLTHLCITG